MADAEVGGVSIGGIVKEEVVLSEREEELIRERVGVLGIGGF